MIDYSTRLNDSSVTVGGIRFTGRTKQAAIDKAQKAYQGVTTVGD